MYKRPRPKHGAAPIFFAALSALCAFAPSHLLAQAPAGPMTPKQSTDAQPASPRPQPSARTRDSAAQDKPVPAPRKDISGSWNFNRTASDDARSKLDQARTVGRSTQRGNGPLGGNGPFGGNGPYGGGPLGGGYPYPGNGPSGGGPNGGGPNDPNGGNRGGYGNDSEIQSPIMREYIYPATDVTFVLKDSEADLTDDAARKRVFYTDGRKLQKPKDDNYREIAAHWEGNRLVGEERLSGGEHVRRTFELSADGRRLDEEVSLDATRSRSAVTLRYIYDINPNRQ